MHHFEAHELADSWELRAGLLDADPADASISACLRECAAALRSAAVPDVQPKGTAKPFGWLDVHPDGRERIARPGRLHDSDARWVRKATLYEHPPETPDDAWEAARQLSNQSHQDFIRGVQWATQRSKK